MEERKREDRRRGEQRGREDERRGRRESRRGEKRKNGREMTYHCLSESIQDSKTLRYPPHYLECV